MSEELKLTIFCIGRARSVTYGRGDCGVETHIEPVNAYMGDNSFPPAFSNEEAAHSWIEERRLGSDMSVVEVELRVNTR